MNRKSLRSEGLLLITAVVWGLGFVAQKAGMEHTGPFTYNAVRYALGGFAVLPFAFFMRKRQPSATRSAQKRSLFSGALIVGTVMFLAASLQQAGIVTSDAGKAGFITGLYVVIVPFFGLFLGQRVGWYGSLGAILAVIGLYFISGTSELRLSHGDTLILCGAVFWAVHVQSIGHFSRRCEPIMLAALQFLICSLLCLICALLREQIVLSSLLPAAKPILYGGLGSIGLGFTLQAIGQRNAQPTVAAIILSLEALFAMLGGYVILNETITKRNLVGAALILGGMLLSQFIPEKTKENAPIATPAS